MRAAAVGSNRPALGSDRRQELCDHGAVDVGGIEAMQRAEVSAQRTLDFAQIGFGASVAAQVGDEVVEQRLDGVARLGDRLGPLDRWVDLFRYGRELSLGLGLAASAA